MTHIITHDVPPAIDLSDGKEHTVKCDESSPTYWARSSDLVTDGLTLKGQNYRLIDGTTNQWQAVDFAF